MDPTGQILEDALRYFDAAGVAVDKCVDGVVLILGLSTSPERDLDEGYFEGGRLNFQGWLKHVKPRITSLIEAIAERGVEAEPMGWWGYPMSIGKGGYPFSSRSCMMWHGHPDFSWTSCRRS